MLSKLTNLDFGEKGVYFPAKPLALNATITSAGYSRITSERYNWDGLKRGNAVFMLMQYTTAGNGKLRYVADEYTLGPGDAMLLHFPHDNRYWFSKEFGFWEFMYVCLHGSEINRIWHHIEQNIGPVVSIKQSSPIIATLAHSVERTVTGKLKSAFEASNCAYSLAMQLAESYMSATRPAERPRGIAETIGYCRKNFSKDITVDTMARIANLSRHHFTRVFSASEGVSPKEFLRNIRVQAACTFLQSTDMSIKEIAAQCGFYDASYFCKVFRSATGATPNAFRTSGMYGR
jgi:AraC-like DNA-binding protein